MFCLHCLSFFFEISLNMQLLELKNFLTPSNYKLKHVANIVPKTQLLKKPICASFAMPALNLGQILI